MKFFTRIAIVIALASSVCGCSASNSLDALDGGAGAGASGGNGKLPGHVYLMWGLAGEIFSRGLDGLAAKIEKAGVAASVHSMVEIGSITDTIIRNYKRDPSSAPVMLLGHSSGGDVVIAIAERLKAVNIPVALILGFDPTPIAGRIPSNVEMFINLYQATNLIGGASAVPATDFRGRLINVDLREHREIVHITLDKSDVIHALVIDKVVGVAAAAAQRRSPGDGCGATAKSATEKAAKPFAAALCSSAHDEIRCSREGADFAVRQRDIDNGKAGRHARSNRAANKYAALGHRAGQ